MNVKATSNDLGRVQKILLVCFALLLSISIFVFRINFSVGNSLDKLARQSLEPEIALSNGRPTILEFYADWCEVCQEMAPEMLNIEEELKNEVDFVFLNVDNERWTSLIKKYEVNGIPQLNFFNKEGFLEGQSIGLLESAQIRQFSEALIKQTNFKEMKNLNQIQSDKFKFSEFLGSSNSKNINPRSHG